MLPALVALAMAPMPSSTQTPLLKRWQSLKYGMFIHFGMSTFDGNEINDGNSPPSTYDPTQLDVKQWVHVAKLAGMKYAVLTAKHTAGFCLWPSGDYDITKSPVKTDVVAEFIKDCKAEGILPGIYYCILDGHNEHGIKWDAPVNDEYFALIKRHLTQLHTRYHGIFEQWLDIPGKLSPEQRTELYDLVKKLDPNCLVLMNITNWQSSGTVMPPGAWPTDLAVGERTPPQARHNTDMQVDGKTYYIPLEVCDTLGKNWFWVPGDQPRTLRSLYKLYQDSVGRNANLLLDVPPDKTGRIPQASVDRLLELAKVIKDPRTLPKPRSLAFSAKATASNVFHNDAQYAPSMAFDDDPTTRWATDDDQHQAWLQVDLGKPVTVGAAAISEAYPNRVQSFQIQYLQGGVWKSAYSGTTIGEHWQQNFPPVKAQILRLNILNSTIGPTIWEFELLPPRTRKPRTSPSDSRPG